MEASGQVYATAALSPGKNPGTHWLEDWMGPKTGLDVLGERKKDPPMTCIVLKIKIIDGRESRYLYLEGGKHKVV
jgi:hypothetical protein